MRLIGVDWSAQESKRGIAVLDRSGESLTVVEVAACSSRRTALSVIADVIADGAPCLIAIDAPLGWPVGMSEALAEHSAGEGLNVGPEAMFSRETDRFVQRTLKKRPLEVGANLIARTAHSANQFLHSLRRLTSRAIPLLWTPAELRDVGVIEVYPAATKIVTAPRPLRDALGVIGSIPPCSNKHVDDALWCVVAGLHFIRGECYAPLDAATSRREGWIWVRQREL